MNNELSTMNDMKDRLLNSTSKEEIESIVSTFNLDIAKRNILRSAAYSEMIDKVIDEMGARIEKYPGQFSNKELLDYMTALQNQLTKSREDSDIPTIAIQQNIVNVNSPINQFDRESKDRIRDALKAILSAKNVETERIIDIDQPTNDEQRNS